MDGSRYPPPQMQAQKTVQQVSCHVCGFEVPLSEAMVSEAVDYVAYFCGLDCYTAWKARARAAHIPVA